MSSDRAPGPLKINIGLIGFGTVGTGVYEILKKRNREIKERSGIELTIKKICVKHPEKQGRESVRSLLTNNINDILDDEDINVVVEVMGGEYPAFDFVKASLSKGKHVVTANKELIAKHAEKLFEIARRNNANLLYEASVAGSIPIISLLGQYRPFNNIRKIYGIVNGTCNYILTKMQEDGSSFEDALRIAQEKGFAEADSSFDIDGLDAAYKICILSMFVGKTLPNMEEIHVEGIRNVRIDDIKYVADMGYCIKLLGVAENSEKGPCEAVYPCLIQNNHPLASVNYEYNALFVDGDFVNEQMFYGKGAGKFPTANAIVSDILATVIHKQSTPDLGERKCVDFGNSAFRYYLRLNVLDKAGVLHKITKIFGDNNVSIYSILQKEGKIGDSVPIVITTHEALERDMQSAIKQLKSLDVVTADVVSLRICDFQTK